MQIDMLNEHTQNISNYSNLLHHNPSAKFRTSTFNQSKLTTFSPFNKKYLSISDQIKQKTVDHVQIKKLQIQPTFESETDSTKIKRKRVYFLRKKSESSKIASVKEKEKEVSSFAFPLKPSTRYSQEKCKMSSERQCEKNISLDNIEIRSPLEGKDNQQSTLFSQTRCVDHKNYDNKSLSCSIEFPLKSKWRYKSKDVLIENKNSIDFERVKKRRRELKFSSTNIGFFNRSKTVQSEIHDICGWDKNGEENEGEISFL